MAERRYHPLAYEEDNITMPIPTHLEIKGGALANLGCDEEALEAYDKARKLSST